MTFQERFKGFMEGLALLEREAKDAEQAGDRAKADEYREAIRGSAEGIRKWLADNGY